MTRQGVNIKKNKRSKANATSVVTQQQSDLVMPKQHLVLNNQLVQRKVSESFNTISSKQTSYNTKQRKFNGLSGFPIQQKKEEAPSEEKEHRIQKEVVSDSENTSKKTGKEKGKTAKGTKNEQNKPPKKEEEKQPEEPSKEGEEKEIVATATPSMPPPSEKKKDQSPPHTADKTATNPKGSLPSLNSKSMQQATKFTFDMPASKMSAQFPTVGQHFEKGFKATRSELSTHLPPLHVTLDGSKVPPAPKESATFKVEPAPKLEAIPLPKAPKKNSKVPRFKPSGASNPSKITEAAQQEQQALKGKETALLSTMNAVPTADRIVAKSFSTIKKIKVLPSKAAIKTLKVSPELTDYANIGMPDDIRAKIDVSLEPELKMKTPKGQLEKGLQKRDEKYQADYKATEEKIKTASAKATEEQKKAIEASRKDLQQKKEAAMKEAQSMVTDATGKISEARKRQLEKINAKIEEGDKKANDRQDAADAEVAKINAKKEKDIANEKAKAKKKEAAAKKKHGTAQRKSGRPLQRYTGKVIQRGIWSSIVSGVKKIGKSIVKGFKKAVSAIAGVLKKAVKSIVSVAKKAVKGVINLVAKAIKGIVKVVQKAVKGLVKLGAKLLKGIVNTVFAAFPGIKNKLNGWIDKGVEKINRAVDKIANKINSTVDSLKETLDSAVDAAANFVENMALMAIEVAEAGLTGNLGKIPEIMFKRACDAIGLPGEEMMMILRKAKSKFHIILKKMGLFFSNLGKAVKTGFKRFIKNIGKYIKKGLMGVLLGDAAQGVSLPKDLSLGSIFQFIRQILGVGNKQIEERAKEQLDDDPGKKQKPAQAKVIQRSVDPQIEGTQEGAQQGQGGGGFGGFMKFFTGLLSKGPKAVWDFFKQYAGNIIDSILDGIVDMVTQTVIQKAITKVISFLIPGAGWIQAIMSAWKFLKFLRQAILQIMLFVNQILDNLDAVMESKLGFVSDLLEAALSKTIKMVFKFFCNFLGLGKIGSKVSKIIMKVRKPVVKAVDKVIGTFRKFGINLLPEEEPEGEGAVHDDGDPNGEGQPNNGMGGFSSQEEMMQYMQMRQMMVQRQQMMLRQQQQMMMQQAMRQRMMMQQQMMAQHEGGMMMQGQQISPEMMMQQRQMQQALAQRQMQQMLMQQRMQQRMMMQQQMMAQQGAVQQKTNRTTPQQRTAKFNHLFPKHNRLLLQKRDYNVNYNHASDNSETAILSNLYG